MGEMYNKMRREISTSILKQSKDFLSVEEIVKSVSEIITPDHDLKEDLINTINKFRKDEKVHVSLALGEVALFFMLKERQV